MSEDKAGEKARDFRADQDGRRPLRRFLLSQEGRPFLAAMAAIVALALSMALVVVTAPPLRQFEWPGDKTDGR